jgi:periplasmic protein TonB
MFAESTLETTWGQRTRRGWTTLTSFGLQILFIGTLLSIPLLRTMGVPLARTISTPITLGRRADPGPIRPPNRSHSSAVEIVPYPHARMVAPGRIPTTIVRGADAASSEFYTDGAQFPVGVGPSFAPTTDLALPISGMHPVMPKPAGPATPTFRSSRFLQGSLIRRVEPNYPPLARSARIQGPVLVEAIIGKDGTMQHVQLVSGHPMLSGAAIEAVRQWRYRPYILNGEAIEVETQITVNFILAN